METATVTAGLIYVLEDWRAEPHSYTLMGIPADVGQHVKVRAVGLDGWKRGTGTGLGIA